MTYKPKILAPSEGGTGASNTATAGKILIGDGTNFVSSTPTYPNTSASAGKILISDGTNFVASTPTYPNTSATSGKLIQSDGTNFIASTPTWPTTIAQGDIIYGSATSVVSALAKNTTATRYLSNTGTTNNPAWAQVALSTGVSDYATGTFTAAVGNAGGAPTVTYSTQRGFYTRLGNMISIYAQIVLATYTAGTGAVQLTGLPFTSNASNNEFFSWDTIPINITFGAGNTMVSANQQTNTTICQFQACGTAAAGNVLQAAAFAATTQFIASGFYQT